MGDFDPREKTLLARNSSLMLFLRFLTSERKSRVQDLDLNSIEPDEVIAFLTYLEEVRKNGVTTLNVRLATIHAFFRYMGSYHPEQLDRVQRILAVPFKRARQRVIEYLERDEIEAVLSGVNRASRNGAKLNPTKSLPFSLKKDHAVIGSRLGSPVPGSSSGAMIATVRSSAWITSPKCPPVLKAMQITPKRGSAPVHVRVRGRRITFVRELRLWFSLEDFRADDFHPNDLDRVRSVGEAPVGRCSHSRRKPALTRKRTSSAQSPLLALLALRYPFPFGH